MPLTRCCVAPAQVPAPPLTDVAQGGSGALSPLRCFPPVARYPRRGLAFAAGEPGPQGGRRAAGEAQATRGPRRKSRRCRALPQADAPRRLGREVRGRPSGLSQPRGFHARNPPSSRQFARGKAPWTRPVSPLQPQSLSRMELINYLRRVFKIT